MDTGHGGRRNLHLGATEASIRRGITTVEESLAALPGQLIPLRVLGLLHDLDHYHSCRVGGDVETPLAAARAASEEAARAQARACEINRFLPSCRAEDRTADES